jgi:hypothetical protein
MLWVAMPCLMHVLAAGPPATAACNDPSVRRYEPRTFQGYACEADCERHKAGFRWAERHLVTDPRACASLPQAEAEGCVAYADAGQDAEGVGSRWAVENEIVRPCQCAGAGEQFRVGCAQAVETPADPGK